MEGDSPIYFGGVARAEATVLTLGHAALASFHYCPCGSNSADAGLGSSDDPHSTVVAHADFHTVMLQRIRQYHWAKISDADFYTVVLQRILQYIG